MVNPIAIANFFIKKANENNVEMTPMKLIKLAYISHGWYLGLTGEPLLPEAIQAWRYGPVVPSIYKLFCSYGKGNITQYAMDYQTMSYPFPENQEIKTFLEKIWDVYGRFNGLQLSALTHQPNTPWYETWNLCGGKKQNSVVIRDELIRQHYAAKRNLSHAAN